MMRFLLAGVLLFLAPIVALQAHINAGGSRPGWATAWNGFRTAAMARSAIQNGSSEETLHLQVDRETVALAQKAYGSEPFATDAVSILALARDRERVAILRVSREMDRRNRLTGLILLQEVALRGDLPTMLLIIDELSHVDARISAQLVDTIVLSLEDPASVPMIEEALRAGPTWAPGFWRAPPREGVALNNFLLLRDRLAPDNDEEATGSLLRTLVAAGRLDAAWEIYTGLAKSATKPANLPSAKFPPLDWQLARGRNAEALVRESQAIDIFVERGSSGELARKLVKLKPGLHRLEGQVTIEQGRGNIVAELTCASDTLDRDWLPQELDGNTRWQNADNTCTYAWLVIEGSAWDSSLPFKATIKSLSFSPIQGN